MVGFDPGMSLVPLTRYANSKIRAQRSRSDFLTWARGGKESTQIRDNGGHSADKVFPSFRPPILLDTWEKKTSWRHDIRARFWPGYRWAVHGVLNPRYGIRTPDTTPNGSVGLQNGADDQEPRAETRREQPRPAPSHKSTNGSTVPATTNSFIPGTGHPPTSPHDSDPQPFRGVPVNHDRHGQAGGSKLNETNSLYANRLASVASSSQSDGSMPSEVQHLQVADSLRSSTLIESQDKSDASADTGETTNEDILAALNRGMDRTLKKVRGLALQRIRNGALDRALHAEVLRGAAQEVFGTMSWTESVHDRPSPESLPQTETTQVVVGAEAPKVTVNLSTEGERGIVLGWVGDALVGAHESLHPALGSLAPPAQESSVVAPGLEEGKYSRGQPIGVKVKSA